MKKFAVLFTLLILAISLSAQTSRTWTGSTSTDWNTDSNWSPSGVPSSSDHIVLNNGSLTNMPLLDASYSINNITVSAGTLDLNGYTLTITGTTSLTGGNINNGTATFSNNTTTIAGTNCGAKVNITANTVTLNTSTFNKKVVIIKNGNSADYWASGTFNDTLDIHNSSTSGSLMVGSNYTLNLNENVWISNSSSGSITFGHNSNGGKTVLASGKKIQIGSGGFTTGTLSFLRIDILGTLPIAYSLGNNVTINIGELYGSYNSFNCPISLSAGNVSLFRSIYNKKLVVTKTANSNTNGWGGNIYNDTLDVTNASTGTIMLGNFVNDSLKGDVWVSNTSTGYIAFGHSNNGTKAVLLSGKKIQIGSGGFNTGALAFYNLNVLGTSPISYSLPSTATILIGDYYTPRVTYNCPITLNAGTVHIYNTIFNKKLTVTKTATATSAFNGNSYNDTLDIINSSTGTLYLASSITDSLKGNVWFSNTSTGQIALGHVYAGSKVVLSSGKSIQIGTSGYGAGTLSFYKFERLGTMPVSYSFSNSVTVDIGYVGGNGSIFNGPVNITAGNINVNSSTFHKKALFNKTSNTTNSFNANTFNDTLDITNSSTAGALFISSNGNNFFNEDIYLSNTGSAGIYFGFSGNTATLAAGKKIYIGSSGFTAGNLAFYKFTQSGSTAQSITTTGTSTVTFGSANATVATFNGAITVSAPNLIFNGSVFNSTLTATKTSSSTNNSTGGNTFNGDVVINNNGSGYINMAYNYADTYTGNATFNKNSTGDITLSINGNTTFKGDATLVSSSAASFATGNIIFNGSNNQTLTKTGSGTLSFGRLTINKASNNLTLSSPLTVSTALTLTSGKIITTGTNILNLADNATVSGASNSSYVQGPMKKTGNDAFTFPTGKNNYYRPIGIAAPTIAATVFTAEYLDANQTLGTTADTSIANLSDCEHWTLTRSGSSDNVNVTLSWNSTSCNGALASNMRVAGWNGSLWTNYGNGSRTGTSIAGTVTTGTTPTAFNAFTLGNKNCTGVATITPSGATSFCSGNNITLSTPAGAKKYTWLPSGFTNSITVSTSNEYFVKVVDSLGCTGKDSVDVNVWANPTINAGTDTVIIAGDTIQLNATAGGGATPYTYEWTPSTGLSSTTVANPFVYPDTLSNYIVKVTDTNGCINRDTLKVWVGILNFTLSTDTANIGDSVFIFINCSGFPSDTLKLFFGDFCDEYSNLNYQACNQQTLMVDTLLKKYYVKGDLLVQLSYKTLFKVKPISILGNCTNCPFPICDLVCNGDFETTTSSFFGGINCASANNIDLACPWTDDGENATADHYNTAYADDSNGRDFHPPATVFSNSMGFNGSNGYAGIATFTNPPNNTIMPVREYIREPLIEPLVPGIQYKCSMQIKRSAPNSNDCNNKIFNQFATEIGFVLSENATDFNFGTGTSSGKLVPINNFHQKTTGIITDDNNWTNVELTFTNSFSNISWITIGRFGNVNDNSPQPTNLGFTLDPDNRVQAYYLIDNVSIVPILDEVNPLSVDNQTPCVNEEITLTVDDGFTVIAWVINGVPNYFIPTTNVINYTIPESANDTFTIGVSLELHGCEFYKEVAIYPNAMCCPGTVDIRNLLYPVNKITSATVLANASGYYDDYLIPSTNQFSTGYNRCGFGTAFTLALSGTFEIDQDFEFSYADVILAKDAKIIVKPGKTLTITNSHLHACSGFMWKSIIVENGGNLIIQGSGTNPACGTLIQDAEVAIDYWGNSNFDIITSEFDNNYRHVQIRDFTGAHNFFASNSTFHKTGNLLLPYSSLTRSMSCINIPLSTATAASIMIGDPSDIDNQNYFADAQYGIIGRDVSVTSQNNMFENIKGNITTAAIYTYPRFKTNYSLTVGNTNPATRYKNIFTDCTNGIRAFSRLDANIHRNDFTNIQRVGINIYNAAKIPPAGSLLNITYNDMTTVRTGILLNNIRPISSVVNYNSIDNTAIDLGIGISQSEGWTAKGTFEINENTITGVSHGIIARGLTEAVGNFNVDGFECIGNNVTVTSANSDYPIGISALQCPDVLIRQNNVFGDDQNWDGGSGIEVDLCNNADVFCNSVEDIGRSFWFERNNFPTRFAGNRMENGESAVVLIDNAICGQQAPAGQFNWNQFFGPYDFSFNVFNSDGVTAMSKFVIWNTISEFSPAFFDTQRRFPLSPLPNPVISNDISESFIFPIEPPLPNYVDDCFDNILPTHLLWAKVMIADSSSRYDTLNSKWRNWKYLYEYIKGDSILSVSTDTVITNFLDSMENHSIGDLHIVNSLIQVDSILDADDLNKLLATTTDMEYLQKEFYQWIIDKIIEDADSVVFTESDSTYLHNLAFECPQEKGDVVFMARTYYSYIDPTVYPLNICEIAEPISPRMQNQQQQVDTKIQKVTFYPNPAQNIGYFNVDNLLENETLDISIYSMEGALLFERHTDTGQSIITVDFTTFANGMYYYNIATNTNKAFRGKFFVIK